MYKRQARFNDLVIRNYRIIEEKLQGFVNNVYRQVNAGTNATLLVRDHQWPAPKGYESLTDVTFIDKVMLQPPMLMHTKSNKREGVFSAVDYNPVDHFAGQMCIRDRVRVGLKHYLASYLAFQKEVITRRTRFDLRRAQSLSLIHR